MNTLSRLCLFFSDVLREEITPQSSQRPNCSNPTSTSQTENFLNTEDPDVVKKMIDDAGLPQEDYELFKRYSEAECAVYRSDQLTAADFSILR